MVMYIERFTKRWKKQSQRSNFYKQGLRGERKCLRNPILIILTRFTGCNCLPGTNQGRMSEAVVRRCSSKKMLSEILEIS